jgi:hypothetical protein
MNQKKMFRTGSSSVSEYRYSNLSGQQMNQVDGHYYRFSTMPEIKSKTMSSSTNNKTVNLHNMFIYMARGSVFTSNSLCFVQILFKRYRETYVLTCVNKSNTYGNGYQWWGGVALRISIGIHWLSSNSKIKINKYTYTYSIIHFCIIFIYFK